MGLLNVGTRALQANQVALQTAGNNIANVNVPGYSRQRVVLETVPGQFSASGYVGQGVSVQTIQRNFSEFLTRQSTLAASTQSADATRSDKLRQLEGIFAGGPQGLGASISDMMNSFSDVANAPTDMTARTVVLTRIDETASRLRAASQQLDDLQTGVSQELAQKVTTINSLAQSIAAVNEQITRVQGTGQEPNDLLDRRDQLIKELNQYVQTTSVKADDGSVGLYIGGSQELVLGNNASKVAIVSDDYGDSRTSKLAVMRSGTPSVIDENMLGGGEVPGLLRFQNSDLNEGRNLLGRLTLATTTAMNDQHKLGLDLDGNPGGDLFSPTVFGTSNVMIPKAPAILNTGGATLTLSIADTTKFAASDYEIQFTSGTTGNITRRSDGSITAFNAVPISIDGLDIAVTAGAAAGGDRFLIKPFTSSASNVTSMFSTPRALAVANPVVPYMGPTNTGSLQLVSLNASGQPAGLTLPPSPVPPATTGAGVQLTYSSGPPAGFLITGSAAIPSANGIPVTQDPITGLQTIPYTPGVTPVAYTPNSLISLDGWQIKLTGAPSSNDSITIGNAKDPQYNKSYFQNAGNAAALMELRDVAMFDGAAMTDGYAGLISQIGIRTQSADYAAKVSATIATNVERDRAGVSGVNLDEEAASLLQYQQAYQASAKMIQIAQNIFDTLIQNLSR